MQLAAQVASASQSQPAGPGSPTRRHRQQTWRRVVDAARAILPFPFPEVGQVGRSSLAGSKGDGEGEEPEQERTEGALQPRPRLRPAPRRP